MRVLFALCLAAAACVALGLPHLETTELEAIARPSPNALAPVRSDAAPMDQRLRE